MEKLSICRICLMDNVRMYSVFDTKLLDVYEKLTSVPFITGDMRPLFACFMCYARLKKCYQFTAKCLESEETFTQMLYDEKNKEKDSYAVEIKSKPLNSWCITPVLQIHLSGFDENEDNVVKGELSDVAEDNLNLIPNNEPTPNPVEKFNSNLEDERQIISDSEDDEPLSIIKIGEEIEAKMRITKTRDNFIKESPEDVNVKKANSNINRTIEKVQTEKEAVDNNIEGTNLHFKSDTINNSNLALRLAHLGGGTTVPPDRIQMENKATHTMNTTENLKNKSNENISQIKSNDSSNNTNVSANKQCFTCDLCKRNFDLKVKLIHHIRTHSLNGDLNGQFRNHAKEISFKCVVCQRVFNEQVDLNNHLRTHIGEKLYKSEPSENFFRKNKITSNEDLIDKPNKCEICERRFKEKEELKKHVLLHIGDKAHQCSVCQRNFAYKHNLKNHMLTHTGEKPYKCDVCQRSFAKKSNLKDHILTHTGEKKYECELCQMCFRRTSQLKAHIFSIHSNQKPFKCDICQRRFTKKHHLNSHIFTHTREKPFKCDICQSGFVHKSDLNNHIRIHTGEKPFKCDVCQKDFRKISQLKAHIRNVHAIKKNHKCDICLRCFSQNTHLRDHIRIHTGEKPYRCDECQSSFSCKSQLKMHIRIHTGEKPYKCEICQRCFRQNNQLKVHIRLVHMSQ